MTPLAKSVKRSNRETRLTTPISCGPTASSFQLTNQKNTKIPTTQRRTFATNSDLQTKVTIKVYQGQDDLVRSNSYLGEFTLGGLVARPAGNTEVQVAFDIDADGVLKVSAIDITTGKQTSVSIQPAGGLSGDEVLRITRQQQEAALAVR